MGKTGATSPDSDVTWRACALARLMIGTKEPVSQIENRQTDRHRASPTTGNRTHVAFRVGLPGFNERVLALLMMMMREVKRVNWSPHMRWRSLDEERRHGANSRPIAGAGV